MTAIQVLARREALLITAAGTIGRNVPAVMSAKNHAPWPAVTVAAEIRSRAAYSIAQWMR